MIAAIEDQVSLLVRLEAKRAKRDNPEASDEACQLAAEIIVAERIRRLVEKAGK